MTRDRGSVQDCPCKRNSSSFIYGIRHTREHEVRVSNRLSESY